MTDAQIDFVLEVQRAYDQAFPLNDIFEEQMFVAVANDRDIEVAKLTAYMLIELWQAGRCFTVHCAQWVRLFEPLYFPGQATRVN